MVAALGLALGLLVTPGAQSPAIAVPAPTVFDSPVGNVNDGAIGPDGTTYAVGSFSEVGAATGGLARLDGVTADVDRYFPTVNGGISAMVTDAHGAI